MAAEPLVRRVLMSVDAMGGVWPYALELTRHLGSAGVEITIAALGREPTPAQRDDLQRLPGTALHTSTFKLEWMPDCGDDVRASGEWLLALEREIKPDLVHLNGFSHGALPWSAPSLVVAHSCVLSWWQAVKGVAAPAEWERYRDQVRRGVLAADLVIAPTHAMGCSIQELYGRADVQVIANGRDSSSELHPGAQKHPIVFAAGRLWDEAKNLQVLDRACTGLSWPLYFAGEMRGPQGQEFVPSNGVALGAMPPADLAQWLRHAAVYAFPAKYEPFGLSVLEAALCGCALVLGDIPSLREVWADAAIYVAPDEAGALREALETIIAAPAMRLGMARRARERALSFTGLRMASEYLATYTQLVGASRGVFTGTLASV
jgi:glycogen(starch) synthase